MAESFKAWLSLKAIGVNERFPDLAIEWALDTTIGVFFGLYLATSGSSGARRRKRELAYTTRSHERALEIVHGCLFPDWAPELFAGSFGGHKNAGRSLRPPALKLQLHDKSLFQKFAPRFRSFAKYRVSKSGKRSRPETFHDLIAALLFCCLATG